MRHPMSLQASQSGPWDFPPVQIPERPRESQTVSHAKVGGHPISCPGIPFESQHGVIGNSASGSGWGGNVRSRSVYRALNLVNTTGSTSCLRQFDFSAHNYHHIAKHSCVGQASPARFQPAAETHLCISACTFCSWDFPDLSSQTRYTMSSLHPLFCLNHR